MDKLARVVESAGSAVDRPLVAVIVAAFAVMLLLLLVQVVGRYAFNYSSVHVIETAQILFVWVCFLGIAAAYRRRAHVSLEYLLEHATRLVRLPLWLIVQAACATVFVVMFLGGLELCQRLGGSRTPGMEISVAWLYAAPATSGLLLLAFQVEAVILAACGRSPEKASDIQGEV